ncbi:MAG: phage terminase large subunit [Ignavibacteriaceae bacterium]|nr:phage terminase large subunit [Ignavibacteriaceae bacterium]
MEVKLEVAYHPKQKEIFFGSDARFKVIAKGRRFGLTRGFANYVIEAMLGGLSPILWVDTVYGNIERYVERYFKPVLNGLPKYIWQYRGNRNDLRIGSAICDFRSADRPENIEGFGYALVVLNEAGIILKNRALWNESIRPMIMDYKARVLIGGTPKGRYVKRNGEEHLFYELYNRGASIPPTLLDNEVGVLSDRGTVGTDGTIGTKEQWRSFNFSSYDNPLLDKDEIDEMVMEIPPMLREQEVFGRFVETETEGIIKREWWRFYQGKEKRDRDGRDAGDDSEKETNPETDRREGYWIQSWDTAFKKNAENDYSVCTTWMVDDGKYYLVDMWRGRVEFPELKKKVAELFSEFRPDEVLIEDKASGQSLIQELQRETVVPVKAIRVASDKITRASIATPLMEAGKVFLPSDRHWCEQVIRECEEFPGGQFDDIVDSVTQALNYLKDKERMRSIRIEGIESEFAKRINKIRMI